MCSARHHSVLRPAVGICGSTTRPASGRRREGRQRMGLCGKRPAGWARALVLVVALAFGAVGAGATWGATGYDPTTDPYSMANMTAVTGAQAWWNAGYTGKGIDVAVIDTGVAPVAGLSGSGKV